MKRNKNQITEKGLDAIITLLQTRIGMQFSEMSASDFRLPDDYSVRDLQNAAETMCQHMKMDGYTPIIILGALNDSIAGNVSLDDSPLVFVRLDEMDIKEKKYNEYQVLSIIAHELCHKFLRIHGIMESSRKVEYITDACAVFVGFGEILHKGYHRKDTRIAGSLQITSTMNIGYLDLWQISYIRNRIFGASIPILEKYKFIRDHWTVISVVVYFILIILVWIVFFCFICLLRLWRMSV